MPKMFDGRKGIALDLGFDVDPNKRGRLPANITAAVDAAIAAGTHAVIVKEVTPRRPKTVVTESKPVKEVKESKPTGRTVLEPAPMVWPENTRAFVMVGAKRTEVSMRNACGNCRVSLHWCKCISPAQPVISYPGTGTGQTTVTLEVPS